MQLFGSPREAVVDMRSLFNFLVESLGSKEAVDSVTKEDAVWKIIDFFSKSNNVFKHTKIFNENQNEMQSIDEKDIA